MRKLLKRNYEYWNHEKSLTALLIYIMASILCQISLGNLATEWWAVGISNLTFDLILLAGVFSVYVEWKKQLYFIAVAIIAGLVRPIGHFYPDIWILILQDALAFLFFALLARMVLRHIFKEGPMTQYRIQGSVVIFLIIGLMYAMLYATLSRLSPNAFLLTTGESINDMFSQMLYFSFVTMTTMGLGDMIPVLPLAKALVVFQGMIGLLYPVIMIARLVSLEVAHTERNKHTNFKPVTMQDEL